MLLCIFVRIRNFKTFSSHHFILLQHYGYVHLSAGDLLREERARKDSEVGQLIEGHIRNGTIVPVEITCSLLEQVSGDVNSINIDQLFLFSQSFDLFVLIATAL